MSLDEVMCQLSAVLHPFSPVIHAHILDFNTLYSQMSNKALLICIFPVRHWKEYDIVTSDVQKVTRFVASCFFEEKKKSLKGSIDKVCLDHQLT